MPYGIAIVISSNVFVRLCACTAAGSLMTFSIILTIFLLISPAAGVSFTRECISRAKRQDCSVFNNCCQFRCGSASSRVSTCIADRGFIQAHQSECSCSFNQSVGKREIYTSSRSKMSRIDIIAGVMFIFVTDMFLLSCSF